MYIRKDIHNLKSIIHEHIKKNKKVNHYLYIYTCTKLVSNENIGTHGLICKQLKVCIYRKRRCKTQ